MLCSVCQSIDFNSANCPPYPGEGAKHQPNFHALSIAADDGCELCDLIRSKVLEKYGEVGAKGDAILCNLWNWYEGPPEEYRGSATVIFYADNWSVILGISADVGSTAAVMNLVSGRSAQLTANSEACFEQSRRWLTNCLSNHRSSCPSESTPNMPTRVLDVGYDLDSSQVKVLETKSLRGTWVALSHCWGSTARFVLESTNIQQRTQDIALSELPKTFLDAVIITRKLGYRYLWIDSLCILQDSYEDWAYESRQMQDYYSKSVLTIASDLASGDHESFLDNQRSPLASLKIPFTDKNATSPSYVYISKEYTRPKSVESISTPLNVRGWTLQEDMLSPRTLHYTSTELLFECQRCRFSETDTTPQGYTDDEVMNSVKRFFLRPDAGLDDPILIKYPHLMEYYHPINRWYRLVEDYCSRFLTFESDRLAALAGLAKELQRQTKFSYKAGIWLDDIHVGLLWAVNGRGQKPDKYRAPSWSWAGLDIDWYLGADVNPTFQMYTHSIWIEEEDNGCAAEILGCEVETANGDPFGEVISGQLRLCGYILPLKEWRGKTGPFINNFRCPIVYHHRVSTTDAPSGMRRAEAADQLLLDFDVTPINAQSPNTEGSAAPGENRGNELDVILDNYPSDIVIFRVRGIDMGDKASGVRTAMFACLLLVPRSQDGSRAGYCRVGTAEVPDIDGLGRDGWVQKDITVF